MVKICIDDGELLLPDGSLATGSLLISDGVIAEVRTDCSSFKGSVDTRINATGRWVLPGIVDIHGDAFERQLMPRPGVSFPMPLAFQETDRQLISNGITTAFHGITYSWEPGLRGKENFYGIKNTLARLEGTLKSDSRIHLRFETYNLDAVEELVTMIRNGEIGLLAFNDHTPKMHGELGNPQKLARLSNRSGLSGADFTRLADAVIKRADEVPGAIKHLSDAARQAGITQLSHDDENATSRHYYNDMECTVAEFPLTEEAIETANELGNDVVMGSPNVVRGGSHNGGIQAAEMVKAGLCNILATDYYYPSALAAVFTLVKDHGVSLGHAWSLVSRAPAEACRLTDRGILKESKRADIILVDPLADVPSVSLAIAQGNIAYQI